MKDGFDGKTVLINAAHATFSLATTFECCHFARLSFIVNSAIIRKIYAFVEIMRGVTRIGNPFCGCVVSFCTGQGLV